MCGGPSDTGSRLRGAMQAENVEMLEGNKIKFDFLGKDSIRYENVVDVDPEVWRNMKDFKAKDKDDKKKKGEDQLFDTMCAQVCSSCLSGVSFLAAGKVVTRGNP